MIAPVQASLQVACKTLDDRRPNFFGSIAHLGVPGLLMMLESARKTGRLILDREYMTVAIDFVDGQVVDVLSPGFQDPEEILFLVIDWTSGTFELTAPGPDPGTHKLRPRTITQLLIARDAR